MNECNAMIVIIIVLDYEDDINNMGPTTVPEEKGKRGRVSP